MVENSLELVTTPGMCVGASLPPPSSKAAAPGCPLTHSRVLRYPTWYTPTPIVVVRGTEVEFRLAVFSGGGFSVGFQPLPHPPPSPLPPPIPAPNASPTCIHSAGRTA